MPVTGSIRFRCSDEQAAVLVLKRGAHREEVPPGHTISSYVVRNHAKWYRFAVDVVQLDIREEDVIFIRGSLKTAEWAVAAAVGGAREGELVFGGDFGPSMKAGFSVGVTQRMSMSIECRTGPLLTKDASQSSIDEPPFDQCVFLLYYKLKRRPFLTPKVIRGAAGPRDSPNTKDPDTNSPLRSKSDVGSDQLVLESFPLEQKV